MNHIFNNKGLLASLLSIPLFVGISAEAQHVSLDRKVSDERGIWGKTPQAINQANNIFKGAKVSVSGQYGTDIAQYATDGLIDGSKYWGCENLPIWHQVELPKARRIESIKLWLLWTGSPIYQYKVEGSLDGNNWNTLVDQSSNSIAFTPDGLSFNFEPREVRFIRTTITSNSRGAKTGGHVVEIQGFEKQNNGSMMATVYSDLDRLPWTGQISATPAKDNSISLTGWRGERVNAQILIQSAQGLKQLRLKSGQVSARLSQKQLVKKRSVRSFQIAANFIKFTQSHGTPVADIISNDSKERMDDAAGINRSVWVSIDIPSNAMPTLYKGEIIVSAQGEKDISIPVEIKVQPQTLPAAKDWNILLDIWQQPDSIARWHDVAPWSDEHFAIMKPMMKRLADSGQKVITASLIDEAWNGQTFDKFGSMIEWIKQADGSMRWDYTNFDKWVDFMINEVGIKEQISCYTMIPWSMKLRVLNEATGEYEYLDNNPRAASYEKSWGPFLTDFVKHVKAKGWEEITTIAIDERPDYLLRPALGIVKKYAPQFEIASAISHPSSANDLVYSVSVGLEYTAPFTPEMRAKRRAVGQKTTFYTCCNPVSPNTFTASPLAESVWLGLYAAVHDYDGYLRWAYNSWGRNPFENTDFGSWKSGDCFLVYPGNLSSLRWEKMRDGYEEFEKYNILRKKAQSNPKLKEKMENLQKELLPRFEASKTRHAKYREDLKYFTEQMNKISSDH